MRRSEAEVLTAKLAGAFPRDWVGEATFAVYAERIERLGIFLAALDAVDALIDTERRLPSVSAIREEYQRHVDKHRPAALPEPPLTEEQRAENVRQARALVERLSSERE